METLCVKIALICISVASVRSYPPKSNIDPAIVSAWTSKLGTNLIGMATYVSRKESIQEAYAGKVVVSRSGEQLLQEIAMNIQNMTEAKISAVKRIMDTAEETAMAHQEDVVEEDYQYYNAKKLAEETFEPTPDPTVKEKEGSDEDEEEEEDLGEEPEEDPPRKIVMKENQHFFNRKVNTSFSVVHVPTNVFEGAPDILRAIKWSEHLNSIFVANYNSDPSLSWQYFGSSLGFMRQYPAAQWEQVADVVDLYDCRTRPWYIEAATSPKDVVILVDNSGSMTGMRREIARHVVNDILDTLGPNDFVNVFNFSDNSTNVVPCFGNGLVQATLENVRELKLGMENLYTDKIANFSEALTKAFLLLQDYRTRHEGAACNQAIMLVTDGVPYNYKEIFRTYNWQDLPRMPVRVFTYLIGREVADVREVKWMACANQGFFVHLSTLSEVKEKVLEYIPVMARPLVLQKNEHPVIWTSVYADVADPKMTDWLWDSKESEEQKEIFLHSRKMNVRHASPEEQIQKYLQRRMANIDEDITLSNYQLMTSVSVPVYDRRENATRIANILGVAGTDVPVKDIQELMMPHKLGVNSYAFLVTNNGHIVIHPDFRPVFQGILKPSYNSVDMSEIELLDDDLEAREESEEMDSFRDAVITQTRGNRTLRVKYHYDKMKRASTATRKYFFCGIENTPFTLVISLPLPYGQYGIDAKEETSRHRTEEKNLLEHFSDKNWKIHPDWTYCRYLFPLETFDTPEAEFIHFLKKALGPGWHWLSKRTGTPPEHIEQCDRDLFLSLVFDGKATASFPKNTTADSHKDGTGDVKEFQERYGVTVSFVATRSGLTRWKDYLGVDKKAGEKHFSEIHNRAIDEIWYKRAVDYHFIQPHSYVYSVPYEAGDKNGTLVTASYAIFHTKPDDDWKAPAAVIGFQFRHSALHRMLFNITSTCPDCPDKHNNKTCASNELECYVVDNNGYVVVAESLRDTGKFFGEIRASVMEEMVNRNMFKRIRIFDYQAVCFRPKLTGNCASYFVTPLAHLKWMIEWTIGYIFWVFANANLNILWFDSRVYASDEDIIYSEEGEDDNGSSEMGMNENNKGNEKQYERWTINRTRPQPCDKEVVLYQMNPRAIQENKEPFDSVKCKRFFEVQVIDQSNLILVVVDKVCTPDESEKLSVAPVEVFYNTSSLACFKVENMQRRQRPRSCISHHRDEDKIELCGGCGTVHLNLILLLSSWFTIYIADFC
ncbi:hypothetical protein R5R35_006993 [Gryllus longicercus]|uniref:VWFA domain-containing protein n=1 Tax=Gryllus longicercus TaxID=2509291 RepID=A0AAN9ZG99_9ORTH